MAPPRLLSVLYTDLVASTETLARLGPEAGETWRRGHLELLREALRAGGGREIQAFGDGLLAVFDGPSAAVAAAAAMQQRVARGNARRDALAPTHVRIGVSMGEVAEDAEGVHGLVVVEAARLCAAARADQVLATGYVEALCAGRAQHKFVSLGSLELKGLPQAVSVVELEWQAERVTGAAPLPVALADALRQTFVGRVTECERLAAAWAQALAGERRLALVAGEPGIGKTRLAAELARSASDAGAIVLHGRADEDLSAPFQPWVQALRHYVTSAAPETLRADLGDAARDLARILPELARLLPDLPAPRPADPETERLRLFEAVDALLAAVSRVAPVLVVLDDLHWADKPSLVLLRHLARSALPGAVLLLGTYRETDLVRAHPLAEVLADLRRESRVERVLLRGLGEAEVGALVASRAQHDAPAEFVHALHAETDGNPFFVEEVLRHLVETGALRREDGLWTSDRRLEELGIPEGIREVVGRRLSRLSEAANSALGIAAVIGRDFDARAIEAAGGPTGDSLLDALDEAARARLIAPVEDAIGRFSFTHALVRQTLYEELGTTRRVRLHWRIGEALEQRFANSLDEYASAIAHHLCEGALAGDSLRAVDASLRAAKRAAALVAHEEVTAHGRRALALLDQTGGDEPERRYEAFMALGYAAFSLAIESKEPFFAAARVAERSGWGAREARAVIGATQRTTGDVPGEREAREAIEGALARMPPGDSTERCLLLARLASISYVTRPPGELHSLVDGALAMARRLGGAEELAAALGAKCFLLFGSPHVDELREVGRRYFEALDATGDHRRGAVWAGRQPVIEAAVLGDRARFEKALQALVRWYGETRNNAARNSHLIIEAADALAAGRFAAAKAAAAEFRARSIVGGSVYLPYNAVVISARLEQGRHAQVLPGLEQFVSAAPPSLRVYHSVLASARAALGRHETARADLDELACDGFSAISRDWGWPLALRHLAETAAVLGAAPIARALEPELEPYSGQLFVAFGWVLIEGAADRALGQVLAVQGRLDEACTHYERALALEEGFGATALAARTRYWWARALAERGRAEDATRAHELASECLATTRELGMTHLESQAAELATELG